jgi:hypothetical protein
MKLVLALVGGALLPMEYVPVVLVGALLLVLVLLFALANSHPGAPPTEYDRDLYTGDRERAADATRYAKGDPGDEPPEDEFPWR